MCARANGAVKWKRVILFLISSFLIITRKNGIEWRAYTQSTCLNKVTQFILILLHQREKTAKKNSFPFTDGTMHGYYSTTITPLYCRLKIIQTLIIKFAALRCERTNKHAGVLTCASVRYINSSLFLRTVDIVIWVLVLFWLMCVCVLLQFILFGGKHFFFFQRFTKISDCRLKFSSSVLSLPISILDHVIVNGI